MAKFEVRAKKGGMYKDGYLGVFTAVEKSSIDDGDDELFFVVDGGTIRFADIHNFLYILFESSLIMGTDETSCYDSMNEV
ncbi:MAG: hypothetical protein HN846_02690 [Candidatus Pacebacteria bacterium]|jgi:hypothetical protein|nr:hypothetical protein [Candidatus Paceibacterota bacterium]MBT3511769.1 hypothetical protein [Candidatus Paceibacterota bacterium]MBT4005194.1 hypothetical protein [Candidatus Paceibacterota bacterium]MBT4359020.1 hypothetical protein [Candidatus Paceibacterota bacterium]MBT4681295.1 hypothetical protein [Candidatus Paceibacterota bacterium]